MDLITVQSQAVKDFLEKSLVIFYAILQIKTGIFNIDYYGSRSVILAEFFEDSPGFPLEFGWNSRRTREKILNENGINME
jgi:hypothetical protein